MTQVKLTTNHGDIVIELNAEKAPITVANFIEYVNAGHYENTVFHRVIGNFMVQGGGFEPGMKEKKDKRPSIQNEADNGLANDKYTVAMARTMEPHSPPNSSHPRGRHRLPQPQRKNVQGGATRVR